MKKIIFTIASALLLLQSCADSNQSSVNQANDSVVSGDEHQHANEQPVIELNNGTKWQVDSGMMVHLRQMESDVNSFSGSGQEEFQILAEKLTNTIDTLTSKCTMKGKAHDELHKWLLPYIDLVDELYNSETVSVSREKYGEVKSAFVVFNEYFQ